MKANSYEFETAALSTQQIGQAFRQSVVAKRGSMMFISVTASFYTPEEPHDPFAAVDNTARPAFTVGAEYTAKSLSIPRGRPVGCLDLSVFDTDGHRRVCLLEGSASGLARRKWLGPDAQSFLAAIKSADPTVRVTTRQERI